MADRTACGQVEQTSSIWIFHHLNTLCTSLSCTDRSTLSEKSSITNTKWLWSVCQPDFHSLIRERSVWLNYLWTVNTHAGCVSRRGRPVRHTAHCAFSHMKITPASVPELKDFADDADSSQLRVLFLNLLPTFETLRSSQLSCADLSRSSVSEF